MLKTGAKALFLMGIVVSSAHLVLGQEGSGQLVGTITDTSHASIPNAKITIVDDATGATRTTTSDSYGGYVFAALPVGNYDVTATVAGFAVVRHTGVAVSVGLSTRLDFELRPAAVVEQVTVTGGAQVLNTEMAEGGRLMTPTEVTSLPLNGRNFLNLVTLTNGVQYSYNTSAARQTMFIDGTASGEGTNFLVDGTDATGIETTEVGGGWLSNQTSTYALSLDSIAEFTVHTGDYSVKYGRAMGGVIEAVTKSGSNQIHGNAFEFFRNSDLNANQTQSNAAGVPIPKLEFNQFGGNSGGPIERNKMFFWLGYEGLRRIVGQADTYTVLSALGRNSVVNPNVANFVSTYLPLANKSSSNPDLGTLVRADEPRIREDMATGRWDYVISQNDSLFARYNIHDTHSISPGLGVIAPDSARQQLVTLSETHLFSPTSVMNFRVGANRVVNLTATSGPPAGLNLSGIFNVAGGLLNNYGTGITEAGDFTHTKGRHTLSTGFEVRQIQNNRTQGEPPGSFVFLAGANQLNNFFNDTPDQLSEGYYILGNSENSGTLAGYFEDKFKATRNLTVTAGLRWDYFMRPQERYGRLIGIVGPVFPLSGLQFTSPGQEVMRKDLNGWGPRLGVAYSVTPTTVIRAGAGIFLGQNYEAETTSAASTFVPPIIPKSAYEPNYVHPQELFTRAQATTYFTPGLYWPNDTWVVGSVLSANSPPPTPDFPLPNWGNTESYQWSFYIEQQVKGSVLSVGYVGTTSHGIIGDDYWNLPNLAGVRPNPAFGAIQLRGTLDDANYNGLQTSFRRPLGRGLELNVHYTYSHAIDDDTGFSAVNDPGVTPQTNSLALQRGDSLFDVRHNFNADVYYNLPFNGLQSRPARILLRGWTTGGIFSAQSGPHYSVTTGTNVGDGVHTQRPSSACGNVNTGLATGLNAQILTASCFAKPAVDPTTGFSIGTLGRNTLTAPSYIDIDAYMQKNTTLTERLTYQLRLESFNLTNATNWTQPINTTNNPNFGKILGAGSARQMQFAMKLIW